MKINTNHLSATGKNRKQTGYPPAICCSPDRHQMGKSPFRGFWDGLRKGHCENEPKIEILKISLTTRLQIQIIVYI